MVVDEGEVHPFFKNTIPKGNTPDGLKTQPEAASG